MDRLPIIMTTCCDWPNRNSSTDTTAWCSAEYGPFEEWTRGLWVATPYRSIAGPPHPPRSHLEMNGDSYRFKGNRQSTVSAPPEEPTDA